MLIGTFDFEYKNRWLLVRGNADYGHLGDAGLISSRNKNQTTMTGNPYPHTAVGEAAYDYGIEAGVDLLAWSNNQKIRNQKKLYLFARYNHYDSFVPAEGFADVPWAECHYVSAGINYRPISEIIVKAEAGARLLEEQYNNEPFVTMGITWTGMFKR